MATATITLSAIENWTKLVNSVDYKTLTEVLNSSTSYTVSDPTSGLSLQILGTGLKAEDVFGYTVLDAGTITGFKLTLNGKPIAAGSDYSLKSSTVLSALETSLLDGNAMPLFDMWFSIKTTVSGTAAVVEGNLANLEPYVKIVAVDITSGAVSVSAADFVSYEKVLNKVVGGFSVSDTTSHVKSDRAKLEADVSHLNSVDLTNGASAPLTLPASQAEADASLLAKLTGDYILEVKETDGSWTTTGHGDKLTIHDIAGVDTITGGGAAEDFVFKAEFGTASLVDFHDYLTGSTHDTVTLAASEFTNFTTLLGDATQSGTSVLITAGSDDLALQNMTLAHLVSSDFKFV